MQFMFLNIKNSSLNSTKSVPTLCAMFGGQYAEDVEKESDEHIVGECMRVLRNMCGENIPEPVDHYVSRWRSDR